ncbi:expression site-associated gene (ESAG) protein, putative [Trypanosoma equiperdum]|uniref:Expression site-associated gene (ESAG) protein, putative n=1 Tax=Trypanosoma equiperdum TaxID=5694 RepID=A0A1G4IFX1_TRYEQ|nr:expression site-associated gene (ESAG) protein, putative [Trypanosoma equiperdum]
MPKLFLLLYVTLFYHVSQSLGRIIALPTGSDAGSIELSGEPFPSGDVALVVNDTAIANIMPTVVKMVNNMLGKYTIPSREVNGIQLGDIPITGIKIGNISLEIKHPNKLVLNVTDIVADAEDTTFSKSLVITSCRGKVRASVAVSSASLVLGLSVDDDEKLKITVDDMNVRFAKLNLTPKLVNWCMVFDNFIIKFIKQQEGSIMGNLQGEIPRAAMGPLEEKLNDFIATAPLVFPESPKITDGELQVLVTIVAPSPGGGSNSSAKTPLLDVPFPERSFGVVASFTAVNTVLVPLVNKSIVKFTKKFAQEFNTSLISAMYPEAYLLCPDCPFMVSVKAETAVHLEPVGLDSLILHLLGIRLALEMKPPEGDPIPAMRLLCNTTVSLSSLYFDSSGAIPLEMDLLDLAIDVETSNIGAIDQLTLNDILSREFRDKVIPAVNEKISTITIFDNTTEPLLNVTSESITFALNVPRGNSSNETSLTTV